MKVQSIDFVLPRLDILEPFEGLERQVRQHCGAGAVPLRFASVASDESGYRCEVEAAVDLEQLDRFPSIFSFRRRSRERTHRQTVVMLVPTGIDCAIGGHAGDATPAARVLAAACDDLVVHPNVVNASDVNEQPSNALYVEGSLICRLLMGTIGLRKVRSNRQLLVTESRSDAGWVVEQTVNCVSGARATLGIDCPRVVVLEEGLSITTGYAPSGRATGSLERLDQLVELLRRERGRYDAIALATRITPHMDSVQLHQTYFHGEGPNPWGGAEAALTHTLSTLLDVPSAHAPTMSTLELLTESYGHVEPRKAMEVVSMTYLFCVLKGLHRAPRVVLDPSGAYEPSEVHAEDVSALVVPDGTLGLPVLAALVQGIPVVAVRANTNLMRNDLSLLPWAEGQLITVDSYLEAAGVLTAMKAGVPLSAVLRPLQPTIVEPARGTAQLDAITDIQRAVLGTRAAASGM